MLMICTVKYVYKISVSTDDDLEGALEHSNTETILRKFFEGTSMRNDTENNSNLWHCDFLSLFPHVITPFSSLSLCIYAKAVLTFY